MEVVLYDYAVRKTPLAAFANTAEIKNQKSE